MNTGDDSASESDTNSVKEPFTDQVDSLNRLLTSADRGLGPLGMTMNVSSEIEDDDLDAEVQDLEGSSKALQRELSKVQYEAVFEETPDNSPEKDEEESAKMRAERRYSESISSMSGDGKAETPPQDTSLSSSLYKMLGLKKRQQVRQKSLLDAAPSSKKNYIPLDNESSSNHSNHSRTSSLAVSVSASVSGDSIFQSLADFSDRFGASISYKDRSALKSGDHDQMASSPDSRRSSQSAQSNSQVRSAS